MRCLIVDDEFLARELLAGYAAKIPGMEVMGKFSGPLDALPLLHEGRVDVLFLDIEMPQMRGLDFLKTLNRKPFVVLTTAYSEYALDAFSLDVADYLVKPIAFPRFLQAVNKVQGFLYPGKTELPHALHSQAPVSDHILVKTSHKTVRLPFSELLMVEGQKEYVCFYSSDQQLVMLEALKNLEEILPKDRFMRVHKSYIVSLRAIKSLEGNELTIESGYRVPLGPSYREEFLRVFRGEG